MNVINLDLNIGMEDSQHYSTGEDPSPIKVFDSSINTRKGSHRNHQFMLTTHSKLNAHKREAGESKHDEYASVPMKGD